VSTSDPVSFADLAKQAFSKIQWTDENLAFYALYNKDFAARVSILAGRIALSDEFIDPNDGPLTQDRGHLIGSFVFDAAHEEFYGRGGHKDKPESRVTHRCLAQHLIRCLKPDADKLRALQKKAKPIIDRIDGNYHRVDPHLALGFHLGSEKLASFEFSELEKQLRKSGRWYDFQKEIAPLGYNGMTWVRAHSEQGDAAEAAHADRAMIACELAVKYSTETKAEHLIAYGASKFYQLSCSLFTLMAQTN
jgi:hypothetical protein